MPPRCALGRLRQRRRIMATWQYDKRYPFSHTPVAPLGGRGRIFTADESFKGILYHSAAVACGHCERVVPKCPDDLRDPTVSKALPYRIWVSPLHTLCHNCAIELSQNGSKYLAGKMCGKPPQIVLSSGPGQERCSQCTLMCNAEPDCWCKECAEYAQGLSTNTA